MSVAGNSLASPVASGGPGIHYMWIALSNTTLGILMVTINQSILAGMRMPLSRSMR